MLPPSIRQNTSSLCKTSHVPAAVFNNSLMLFNSNQLYTDVYSPQTQTSNGKKTDSQKDRHISCTHIQGGPKKVDHFLKCITPVYDDIRRRSIYQNVQLFIRSKSGILNVAIFKYSLHKIRETILHRKCQLIPAIKMGPFLTVCNSCIWWRKKVSHIPNCSVLYLE